MKLIENENLRFFLHKKFLIVQRFCIVKILVAAQPTHTPKLHTCPLHANKFAIEKTFQIHKTKFGDECFCMSLEKRCSS